MDYFLNKDKLLNETASLVSQNLIQGRDAAEVIDELEVIFRKEYDILIEETKQLESKQDNAE